METHAHESMQDTTTPEQRVQALLALSDKLGSENIDRALEYAQQALDEATTAGDTLAIARSTLYRARHRNYRGEYLSALADINTVLPTIDERGSYDDRAHAYLTAGMAHFYLAEYSATKHYAERGLALCEQSKKASHSGNFYNMLAAVEAKAGEHRRALVHYKKAIACAEETGDKQQAALRYSNIANTHKTLGEFVTALEYYQRSYKAAVELDDKRVFIMAGMGIGRIYTDLHEHHRALEYFLRVLSTCHESGFRIYLLACYLNLAAIYFHLHNYTEAVQHALLGLELARQQDNREGEAHALQDLGLFSLHIGDMASARAYLMQALAVQEATGARHAVAASLLAIGRVYLKLQQPAQAREYLLRSLSYYETIEPERTELSKSHDSLLQLYLALAEAASLTDDHASSAQYMQKFGELQQAAEATRQGNRVRDSVQTFEMELALRLAHKYGIAISVDNLAPSALVHRRPKALQADKTIRACTLGDFRIALGNRELTASAWKRKKARDLFKILLVNYKRAVTAEELVDLLWAGEPPSNAQNVVWNAISTTRLLLEPGLGHKMPSSFIRTIDRSYTLDFGENAHIDFVVFRSHIAEAQRNNDPAQRAAMLKRAIDLYKGDFLPEDRAEEWTLFERESLRELWISALYQLAEYATQQGDNDTAVQYAEALLSADQLHLETWELLLRLYQRSHRQEEQQRTEQRCIAIFVRETGAPPPDFLRAASY